MNAERLAAFLQARGYRVRLWQARRVYVHGYGKDVSIHIEPVMTDDMLDHARITVTSVWLSPHVGLRCKGVKHALLCDLYSLGLLTQAPPPDWRAVKLEDRPAVTHRKVVCEVEFEWPAFTRPTQ